MTAGANKISGAVENVNEESVKNKNSIKKLSQEVSLFKIE
jgi:hypothetical protein